MIVPMKRLTLIGLTADEERVLSTLQSLSAVQILSKGAGGFDESKLAKLENRVQRLDNAQSVLKPFAQKAKLGPKPVFSVEQLNQDLPASMDLCARVEELDHRLSTLRSDVDKRNTLILTLTPWSEMNVGIEEIVATESARYITGVLATEHISALEEVGAVVEAYGGEREKCVLIACHFHRLQQITALLRTMPFQEFNFPALRGTPRENIDSLTKEIEDLKKEEASLTAELSELGKQRDELCRALDAAVIERDREASRASLGVTTSTFILDGWIRSDEEEKIRKTLDSITDTYYMDCSDPQEGDVVPTVLKNSKLVAPYEAVTNLYSLPAAHGVDATPLMMPFYFVFFGMMLSDTGYGIVLALGTYLFLKLLKPQGMMASLAKVLFMGGLSTMVMGLLIGTFFGVSWPVIFAGTALANVFPFIDPANDPITMLALCAGLGLVHMYFAVLIATWECIRRGDWMAAIIDNLCWLFIITGLLMLAAPMLGMPEILATVGKWIAIVAASAVFLFAGRSSKSIPGRLMGGAGKLYNVTSWLGDVLSYARIFALGLSTGVIGLVLNTLCWDMLYASFKGSMVLTVIGFVIVLALSIALHLFMLAISTLGCFVHTARLQYVEFFSKFYEAGGKRFMPLRYNAKHVNVAGEQ